MSLSRLTEEFLKFSLKVKNNNDLVFTDEQKLPENLSNHIFGLADELAEVGFIKNLRKYGRVGNRGVDFTILPKALSYFKDKEKQQISKPSQEITFEGPLIIGSENVNIAKTENNTVSDNQKDAKSWFEKYGFPLILVILTAIGVIIAAILGKESVLHPSATLTKVIAQTEISAATQISETNITPINTRTIIQTDTPNFIECSFSNGPITVGVIDLRPNYIYEDIFNRLQENGLKPTWINPPFTYDALSSYDIIYLPSGWAFRNPILEEFSKSLKDFVYNGGGLLVEQPNSSEESFTPTFLPYPITYLGNRKDLEDWPLEIVDTTHILTMGLDNNELPGPMNCADKVDTAYKILVKGSKTGCAGMAIASYGDGKLLINQGNLSPSMVSSGLPTISDETLCRMFNWLADEYD